MFKIINVYNKDHTIVEIHYKNGVETYIVSGLLGKRNKEELDNEIQYKVLNAYLDYKGDKFKEELFKAYNRATEILTESIYNPDIDPSNTDLIGPILDLIKIEDVIDFLVRVWKINPPDNLENSFDTQIETDSKGSRVQTYLKEDYIELAALCIVIKATLPPVAQFGYNRSGKVDINYREYYLLGFYTGTYVFKTRPMEKILGLIERLVEQTSSNKELVANRVLDKFISKEDLPEYILSIILLHKIAVAPLVNDNRDISIITKVYNYINNKLKPNTNSNAIVKDKAPLKDSDSATGDKESLLESYRATQDVSSGMVVEMNFVTDTVEKILFQLPTKQREIIESNIQVLEFAKQVVTNYNNTNIEEIQITIIATIFKSILDPRSYDYIDLNCILNLIAVGFTYLYNLGYKDIAIILLSVFTTGNSNTFIAADTVTNYRLPQELRDKLDIVYPYHKQINDTKFSNLAEIYIEEVIESVLSLYKLNPLIKVNDLGYTQQELIPTSKLKISLAEFLCRHEEIITK